MHMNLVHEVKSPGDFNPFTFHRQIKSEFIKSKTSTSEHSLLTTYIFSQTTENPVIPLHSFVWIVLSNIGSIISGVDIFVNVSLISKAIVGVLRLEVLVFAVSLLAKRAELSKPFLLVFSRLKSGF